MDEQQLNTYTAFQGNRAIAVGSLPKVAQKVKAVLDGDKRAMILIFDDFTGDLIETDFRGTLPEVLARLDTTSSTPPCDASAIADPNLPRRPGRPKLGVVSREVTLLPRHWQWLNDQPGGASVALRKLVEHARRANLGKDKVRFAQSAAYRFMSSMAGNLPGYEEATRALFRVRPEQFQECISAWPADIQAYAQKLAKAAFADVSNNPA